MDQGAGRSGAAATGTTNSATPGNVTLRIVILAHGSGREDDLYLVLSLDTTLGELKNRIQESLSQHPPPSQQRIIYQGRGLDNPDQSLRSILRQEQRADHTSYVLHLVIRQPQTDSRSIPSIPSTTLPNSTTVSTHHPPQIHAHNAQAPIPHAASHNHIGAHQQMHLLQHSFLHEQAIQRAQAQAQAQAQLMAQAERHNHAQIAAQAHANAHLIAQAQAQAQAQTSVNRDDRDARLWSQRLAPTSIDGPSRGLGPEHVDTTSISGTSTQPAQNQALLGLQSTPTTTASPAEVHPYRPPQIMPRPNDSPVVSSTQMRTTVDSTGQQTRTVVSGGPAGSTTVTFRVTGLNPPNPLDRPSSAPGASSSADTDPANRGVNPMPGNIHIQPLLPVMPTGFPFPSGMQLPIPIPNMMPMMNNPYQHVAQQSFAPQPTAWLLSSPNGPQGIVFAPGHGFFSTVPSTTSQPSQLSPTPTVTGSTVSTAVPVAQQAQLIVRTQSGSTTPAAPQPGARPPVPTGGLPVAAQPRAAVRPRARPNLDQNEILQFILGRGWLFLRLYMFVFVFSESGTWRRILMIAAIVVYCSLPRQNPLTRGFHVVRQHFDNLIGPPNMPPRTEQQTQQNAQNAGHPPASHPVRAQNGPSATTGRRSTPMPTPEETARRLLEQQNRRNPNPLINVLYRVEQGLVLFLASLVPGVGERHVRAREEARRILQEEEQRRMAESQRQGQSGGEQASAQPGNSNSQSDTRRSDGEDGPLPDGWKTATQLHEETYGQQGSSSGVDRTGASGNENMRSRNANTGH